MNHDGRAVSSECRRFFAELVPRLDTARTLERELDRNLARRFNCFDYLGTDELGLSRVIADLPSSSLVRRPASLRGNLPLPERSGRVASYGKSRVEHTVKTRSPRRIR